MIKREYPFEDCVIDIRIQGADRSGNVWGLLDILTLDREAHLLPPRRISLFDDREWQKVSQDVARRNSGNVEVWSERAAIITTALIEDTEVAQALIPQGSQLHAPIYMNEVVKFAPISLASRQRPGPRVFRVDGLIPEGWPILLYGDSGHGKSYIAATIGQCVALGDPFLGLSTIQGKVLYLDWELDEDEQTRRAYEIAEGLGLSAPPVGFDYQRMESPFTDVLPEFKPAIENAGYALVIIDSFGLACGGSSEESRMVIPLLGAVRSLKCTVLIIDHQSRILAGQKYRDKDAFGSIFKRHYTRSGIQIQIVVDEGAKKAIALRHSKANFSALREDIYAWLEFKDGRTILSAANARDIEDAGGSTEMGTQNEVRVAFRELGPSTAKSIADHTSIIIGTVRNEITRLKKSKELEETGKERHAPVYTLIQQEES